MISRQLEIDNLFRWILFRFSNIEVGSGLEKICSLIEMSDRDKENDIWILYLSPDENIWHDEMKWVSIAT